MRKPRWLCKIGVHGPRRYRWVSLDQWGEAGVTLCWCGGCGAPLVRRDDE